MADTASVHELKNMILSFRVTELQMLLGFAGRNKSGKKNELQSRAIDLLKSRSLTLTVQNKIRELHRQRYTNTYYHQANGDSRESPGSDTADSMSNSYHNGMVTRSASGAGSHHQQHQQSHMSSHHLSHHPPIQQVTAKGMLHQQGHRSNTDYYGSMPRSITGLDTFSPKPYAGIPAGAPQLPYPVHPDVRLKPLPFYDIVADLLKPASLMPTQASRFQENNFSFHLTPQQANDIAMSRDVNLGNKIDYSVQVQLRFCLLETSCEQEDNFPPSICVKVNTKLCQLPNPLPTNKPGVEPKRPSRPVNITSLVRLSPTVSNQITVSWASEYGRPYAVAVYLVRKLTAAQLLARIKNKGVRNSDHTKAMIKEKLAHDPDSEIATTSLRGSLLCPLGKMRLTLPCRATTCSHVQCFDALLYLQMNEKKPTWICPVCDKAALFQNLVIDGLFTEIVAQAPNTCNEVQFHESGSWAPILAKKENCETLTAPTGVAPKKAIKRRDSSPEPAQTTKRQKSIEVITIDSEDDDDEIALGSSTTGQSQTPVVLSGSSSESETPRLLASPDSSSSSRSSTSSSSSSETNPSTPGRHSPDIPFITNNSQRHHPRQVTSQANPMPSVTMSHNRTIANNNHFAPLGGSNSSTPYGSMPLLNPTPPSFSYPPNFSPLDSLFGPSSSPYPSYTNFHEQMMFNSLMDSTERELSNFRGSPSTPHFTINPTSGSNRHSSNFDPDIISID